jgi:hypothetical protein
VHGPDQLANCEPLAGVAVSVTLVPAGKELVVQVEPQSMPAGVLVTVPAPFPAGVTVSVGFAAAAAGPAASRPSTIANAISSARRLL